MGPGRLLERLASAGWTVSGVDVSTRMVELARGRLPGSGERLLQAPVETLPYPDRAFDAVVATGVLEYVDDPDTALGEIGRVLRPGGRLVASIPNPGAVYVISKRGYYAVVRLAKRLGAGRRPPPGRQRLVGRERFERTLAAHGFAVEELARTSYAVVPSPLDLVARRPSARAAAWAEGRRLGGLLATQLVFAARFSP
jgi:SAM-dependent methyltransferase